MIFALLVYLAIGVQVCEYADRQDDGCMPLVLPEYLVLMAIWPVVIGIAFIDFIQG